MKMPPAFSCVGPVARRIRSIFISYACVLKGNRVVFLEEPISFPEKRVLFGVLFTFMEELSVLIGGKAGDGINSAGMVVAHLFNRMGYRVYMYFDYPSLIKGGHNFAIVRAAKEKIGAHRSQVDFILALNQDTVDFHRDMVHGKTVVLSDRSKVRDEGIGIDLPQILKEEKAPPYRGSIEYGNF